MTRSPIISPISQRHQLRQELQSNFRLQLHQHQQQQQQQQAYQHLLALNSTRRHHPYAPFTSPLWRDGGVGSGGALGGGVGGGGGALGGIFEPNYSVVESNAGYGRSVSTEGNSWLLSDTRLLSDSWFLSNSRLLSDSLLLGNSWLLGYSRFLSDSQTLSDFRLLRDSWLLGQAILTTSRTQDSKLLSNSRLLCKLFSVA